MENRQSGNGAPESDRIETQPQTDAESPATSASPAPDPVRRWTLATLALILFLLAWYLAADRLTPHTGQARVRAFVVPLASQVSGVVETVGVRSNQFVERGDLLFRIDPAQYGIALASAEADLASAEQQLGASIAGLASANANLEAARAGLERARKDATRLRRVFEEDPGAVSRRRLDSMEASLAEAKSRVKGAEAEVERARQQLGETDENNALVAAARAQVERARLDLARTEVTAPDRGLVADVVVDVGNYATAGQAQMTFIAVHDMWIEAAFTENNLGHVDPGDHVEFVLDLRPGNVFKGSVRSVGWGVATDSGATPGSLPTVNNDRDWLRSAQRFLVIVDFDENFDTTAVNPRVGAQADVIIYTGENLVLNMLGRLYIRLISVLSYLY